MVAWSGNWTAGGIAVPDLGLGRYILAVVGEIGHSTDLREENNNITQTDRDLDREGLGQCQCAERSGAQVSGRGTDLPGTGQGGIQRKS